MTELFLLKTPHGLVPSADSDAAIMDKWRTGDLIKCEVSRPRNPQFLRKFFVLLNYAFDSWEPSYNLDTLPSGMRISKDSAPEKHFDRFRKDITIACGHYELVVNIKGDVRAEAKSISFASMDEDQFSELYESAITYLIKHAILTNQDRDEVDAVVEQLLSFA